MLLVGPDRDGADMAKSILVVEDSITARTLLKNILEAAGYRVETAVDGIDAWSRLMTSDFDLVVSDVEMPRMHGFDLTEKIRADRRLAELPVILVTALATPEDRERGIIAGANDLDSGSFGKSSEGRERVLSGWQQLCPVATQDISATCH